MAASGRRCRSPSRRATRAGRASPTQLCSRGRRSGRRSRSYVAAPAAGRLRINVNPLVIWLWIGGAIGVAGALIAVWPAPDARRRRVADVYAARLARDLGRA